MLILTELVSFRNLNFTTLEHCVLELAIWLGCVSAFLYPQLFLYVCQHVAYVCNLADLQDRIPD
jgi:hypothetical protein